MLVFHVIDQCKCEDIRGEIVPCKKWHCVDKQRKKEPYYNTL